MLEKLVKDSTGIFDDVLNERIRQVKKWGEQNHVPYKWLAITMEELGEISQAVLKDLPSNYREECVQLAAVVFAMIESFDRHEEDGGLY